MHGNWIALSGARFLIIDRNLIALSEALSTTAYLVGITSPQDVLGAAHALNTFGGTPMLMVWMELMGSYVAEHTCSSIFCQRQVDNVRDLQGVVHSRLE